MARKTTEKDIIRYIELKKLVAEYTDEINELREQFIDDCIEYGKPDDEKENVLYIEIGKSNVAMTTVCKRPFNTKRFEKEHKTLYEKYREDKTENRITATSDK